MEKNYKKAFFAGGCFWCMEPPYDKTDGVIKTTSGYAGGPEKNPSYEQVSAGATRHNETVEIIYDPEKVSYEKLLEIFWVNIDPLDAHGQFCDKGSQYRSAIFYSNEKEKQLALKSQKDAIKKINIKGEFATEITPWTNFYTAEDYHQNYYKNNSYRYKLYRFSCGRDRRLKQLWK